MTQESALTPEEIEAMDQDLGTPDQKPVLTEHDSDDGSEQLAVRSQEPEAKS